MEEMRMLTWMVKIESKQIVGTCFIATIDDIKHNGM